MNTEASNTGKQSEQEVANRILASAEKHLFTRGPGAFTMDDLADELGVSKKTLYVHFPGKEAILGLIVEGMAKLMRARLEAIINDPKLNTTEKMCRVIDTIGSVLSKLTPHILSDFKRNYPSLYAKIDAIRSRNVPFIFGRLIQLGLAEGSISPDIDPVFASEFWLQAIRGMMDPETLERTQLSPRETLEKSINLFFHGLLSPSGREQYRLHVEAHKKNCSL